MVISSGGKPTATGRCGLAVVFLVLVSGGARSEERSDLPDIVDRVSASAVSISVETTDAQNPPASTSSQKSEPQKPKIVRGSGIVLTADGQVVTTVHILERASKITVVFRGGRQSVAQVVGKDSLTGIALLKVTPAAPLTPAHFGNSDQVRTGQPVFAVENSFGLRGTVAVGIVSAANRDATTNPYPILQTDIVVYPGVPGAPLFSMQGDVVGMVSAAYARDGRSTPIGFAEPSNIVKEITGKLDQSGAVERGFLGLRLREPNEQETSSAGLKRGQGLIVVNVISGSPATNSGIVAGDIIATLNGQPIAGLGAFVRAIFEIAPNTEVTLGAIKTTGREDIRVKLGRVAEPTATAAATPATPTDKPADTAAGCSRYLPSAGMTVSVPCQE